MNRIAQQSISINFDYSTAGNCQLSISAINQGLVRLSSFTKIIVVLLMLTGVNLAQARDKSKLSEPLKQYLLDGDIAAAYEYAEANVDDSDHLLPGPVNRLTEYVIKSGVKQTPIQDVFYYDGHSPESWGQFTLVKTPASEAGRRAQSAFHQLAQGRGGDWSKLIADLQQAVREVDVVMESLLGWCYLFGLGIEQHDDQAQVRFYEAINAGEASGHYGLAMMVLKGRVSAFSAGMNELARMRKSGEFKKQHEKQKQAYEERERQRQLLWAKNPNKKRSLNLPDPKPITMDSGMLRTIRLLDKKGDEQALRDEVFYDHLKKAAQGEQAQALYILSRDYFQHKALRSIDRDIKRAVVYLKRAAQAGSEMAMYELVGLYKDENLSNAYIQAGLKTDPKKSAQWEAKLIDLGNLRMMQLQLTNAVLTSPDDAQHMEKLKNLIKRYPKAPILALPSYFIVNQYLKENRDSEAWQYLQQSWQRLDESSTELAYLIGLHYYLGLGIIKQEYITAISWLKRSWQLDSPVPNIKPRTGELVSISELYNLLGKNSDVDQALLWALRAIELKGIKNGYLNLGKFCLHGLGMEKNGQCALDYFQKVIELTENDSNERVTFGNALTSIGITYEVGLLGQSNRKQAMEWYKKATKIGYSPAIRFLANRYFLGSHGSVDPYLCLVYAKLAQLRDEDNPALRQALTRCPTRLNAEQIKSAEKEAQKLHEQTPYQYTYKSPTLGG